MYQKTRKSLIRFVNDQITTLRQSISPGLTYVDWDSHGDLADVPKNDVVGIHAFSILDGDQLHETTFGITISTYNDENLMVMMDIADWFYNKLTVRQKLTLYDPNSGLVIGQIIMMLGTTTLPVERADTRSAMFIQAHGTVTLTLP